MIVLAQEGRVSRPVGILVGPGGEIPIASVSAAYTVGSIPLCKIGMTPESLNQLPTVQSDEVYTVKVGLESPTETLFTGYVQGDNGRVTGSSITAGITLVHRARDLDGLRISAPSLHPASIMDYRYTFRGDSTSLKASQLGFNFEAQTYFKPGGGKLPDQIIQGLQKTLAGIQVQRAGGTGETVDIEDLSAVIQMLGKIKVMNGNIRSEIADPLSAEYQNTINQWCRARASGSFNAMRSVWDTLTSIFSEFGIHMICNTEGDVFISADLAAFEASDKNYLGPDYIGSFENSAEFIRNIKEVNLISDHIRNADTSVGSTLGTLVTYPPNSQVKGASMAIQMPGWLNPIAVNNSGGAELIDAQKAYARMMYYLERNKLRTLAVSGPLAPRALPGTTATIEPFSAMRTFSGDGVNSLARSYSGYCYQINHVMDAQSKTLQTTFYFRNVTVDDTETITEHPIFDDVEPFAWV